MDDNTQDLVIACPPYLDLEVYSDDDRDISNMSNDDFLKVYSKIIDKAISKLKPNRFAVFIVSNVRDNKGFYRDLVGMTEDAAINAGALLYNELILVNSVGTGALRARNYMNNRKVVRRHQNVLVFFKGNPKEIKTDFSPLKNIDKIFENEEEN